MLYCTGSAFDLYGFSGTITFELAYIFSDYGLTFLALEHWTLIKKELSEMNLCFGVSKVYQLEEK